MINNNNILKQFFQKYANTFIILNLFLTFSYYSFSDMGSQIDENILIAAYIERFTRFVEWPANNSVNNKSKPFVIAVSNNYELYLKLIGLAPSLKIKDKKIEIVLIKTIEDINSNINLLFVGMKDKEKLKQIVKKCADFSILTISNSNGFALKGVIINLYNQENSIRFEINDRKARESGLKISHLLLQKSKIVD